MKRYRLLTGPDDATFCQRVTDALNAGWQLYGSPTLTHDGHKVIAGQAVVLLEEIEAQEESRKGGAGS